MSCCSRCGARSGCCCCHRSKPRVVYYVRRQVPMVPCCGGGQYSYSYVPARSCCCAPRPRLPIQQCTMPVKKY
uniref:Epidermal differentiation protein n=1 Tax=Anolis carolinensis TaxID=28377 RepID=A0A088BHB3_ANOCA|nr:epidermal differentiation protein [Anolis carolinensis]